LIHGEKFHKATSPNTTSILSNFASTIYFSEKVPEKAESLTAESLESTPPSSPDKKKSPQVFGLSKITSLKKNSP
jgi:hypothetical protein